MNATEAIKTNLLTRLICDKCAMPIGWVYEFDLQGSYFYCDFCVKEKREKDGK